MNDSGKRTAQVPALVILASFIIVVAGMKAAGSLLVPFFLAVFIAALPALLLALVQLGVGSALLTALGYFVVNLILGNLLEPKLLGQGLSLSTLAVFLSMVFWGWVLGPIGMILSVPMTSLVKIALESYEGTRGLAVMLGFGNETDWINKLKLRRP